MMKARLYGAVHTGKIDGTVEESVVVAVDCLPFPSNSIDGIVLHHVLELGADPRPVFRVYQRSVRSGCLGRSRGDEHR